MDEIGVTQDMADLKMDAGNITLRIGLIDYWRYRDVDLFAYNSSAL
jgi:hypothetical protein